MKEEAFSFERREVRKTFWIETVLKEVDELEGDFRVRLSSLEPNAGTRNTLSESSSTRDFADTRTYLYRVVAMFWRVWNADTFRDGIPRHTQRGSAIWNHNRYNRLDSGRRKKTLPIPMLSWRAFRQCSRTQILTEKGDWGCEVYGNSDVCWQDACVNGWMVERNTSCAGVPKTQLYVVHRKCLETFEEDYATG